MLERHPQSDEARSRGRGRGLTWLVDAVPSHPVLLLLSGSDQARGSRRRRPRRWPRALRARWRARGAVGRAVTEGAGQAEHCGRLAPLQQPLHLRRRLPARRARQERDNQAQPPVGGPAVRHDDQRPSEPGDRGAARQPGGRRRRARLRCRPQDQRRRAGRRAALG